MHFIEEGCFKVGFWFEMRTLKSVEAKPIYYTKMWYRFEQMEEAKKQHRSQPRTQECEYIFEINTLQVLAVSL